VFLGSSFAFIGSMLAAFAGATTVALGYLGLIIGAVLAGLVYVAIAVAVKFAGVNWLNKLMPAVVIGPTVAIIGLSLAGNAVGDLQMGEVKRYYNPADYQIVQVSNDSMEITKNGAYLFGVTNNDNAEYVVVDKDVDLSRPVDPEKVHTNINVTVNPDGTKTLSSDCGSVYVALICGLVTLAVTMLAATYGKKMVRLIPFILGILAGYTLAALFTVIGMLTGLDALMIVDFTYFSNLVADGIGLSTFFSVPEFTFLTAFGGFGELSLSYIGTIAVAYIPVAFVVFAEHVADHKNISSIIEQDLLEDPGLSRTLLGDGVGSMAGAFFGGCPNTTYGESVGCVAITGNASVLTILTAAVMSIAIAFINPFVAFVNSIPPCVMGGVCVALYGFIAVSGLKMVQKVDLEQNKNLFVVSTILIAGIGGLSLTFGQVAVTAIATALILGVLANQMLKNANETTSEE
jgi:uracil permease